MAEVRVPQCGDILLTVTGSYGIAVQIQENKKFCFQRHIALLKTILTNNKLLEQWLSSGFSKKQFDNSVTGTAQQTLGLNALRSTLLPLPPLAEQQRIVAQIETLLGYVDIIDTDAETLEKSITLAKQKILDLAIRGKLVPQDPTDEPASELLKKIKAEKDALVKAGKLKKDKQESYIFKSDDNCYHENIDGKVTDITDEIPFDLPDGWAWCRMGDAVEFIGGSQPPKSVFSFSATADSIRLIQIRDYKSDKYMTFIPKSQAKRFCSADDIMIGRYGPPIFQILRGLEGAYNVALMKAVPCNAITKNYLYYMLKDGSLLSMIESLSDRTCGQDGVNMYDLKRYIIAIPPLAEQKRIVSQVEKLLSVLETMRG